MSRVVIWCFLILATFYLCTAVIRGDGPGEELVFAPFHGLNPFYSQAEGRPCRITSLGGVRVRLHYTAYETTPAPWLFLYIIGCFVGLPALAAGAIAMRIRTHRKSRTSKRTVLGAG